MAPRPTYRILTLDVPVADHDELTSVGKKPNKPAQGSWEETEAEAFNAQQYVRLHLSTLRKVDVLANILERTIDEGLKTNARWKEIHGGWVSWCLAFIQDHWIVSAIGLASAVAGLVQLIWDII